MRLSYNWLKEYVNIGLSADDLADRLTNSGIEVGSVDKFGTYLTDVVVGVVEKKNEHPYKNNLSMLEVYSGQEILSIVCGAKNMKVGDKVVLAKIDSELPGNRVIRETNIHGTMSQGMLCSAHEIGLDLGDEDEILILDDTAEVGERVDKILGFDDYILDLELTPNRADCLSMIGLAHEVSALTGIKVTLPSITVKEVAEETSKLIKVQVDDEKLCSRYTARIIKDATIKSSPLWLQLKLFKAGIRPINNIVDITNLVMLEFGQPLHAFDLDKLDTDSIVVRRAKENEVLVTLDGIDRNLDKDVLVISDHKKAIALAGVMGGEETEISTNTKNILLEAAAFDPINIRRTARKYQLPSEASQRFEKGIDPEVIICSQNRSASMIAEMSGGVVTRGVVDKDFTSNEPVLINIRQNKINNVLGIEISGDQTKKIFTGLGFSCEEDRNDSLKVTVPLRRSDIKIEEDLIEEIVRIYGYDKIPLTLPKCQMVENGETVEERVFRETKNYLTAVGFYESVTNSFINKAGLYRLNLDEDDSLMKAIPVKNPISEEQGVMRTTLIPGLMRVAQHNFSHRELNQLFYEIGKIYMPETLPVSEAPEEKNMLALIATGVLPEANWAVESLPVDFFLIKGILERLFSLLRIKNVSFNLSQKSYTHPTRSAIVSIGNEEIGMIGQLHPTVAASWDIEQPIYFSEIDFDLIVSKTMIVPKVNRLPRYPSSRRDIAIVVSREIPAEKIEKTIYVAGGNVVQQVVLFDLYEGEQVPEGKRSMAYSIVFRSDKATLTDAEINLAQDNIKNELFQLGAVLRG